MLGQIAQASTGQVQVRLCDRKPHGFHHEKEVKDETDVRVVT
ncbi:hypothetical protein [Stappia sp. BW2]|nr:hypothetical protein [Stappia sp. BW2]